MILRLSKQFASKLDVKPYCSLPLDSKPLADWSAHLFVANQTEYWIAANTASLISIINFGVMTKPADPNFYRSWLFATIEGFANDCADEQKGDIQLIQ